ncbi:hypothetical protein L204_102400 [Cryptococcus depauperatus]|nr:hypothetical protein L204_05898 [Cryptococcus depauperatus CBS 7855]
MPHKRAKRAVREAESARKGLNLPPSLSAYDDAPRSATRILNSWKVQQRFRESGRKTSEDTGEPRHSLSVDKDKRKERAGMQSISKIMPQETLAEYNRRVEISLRPSVSNAIKSAEAVLAAEKAEQSQRKKENKRRARLVKLVKEGKVKKEILDEFNKGIMEKKRKRKEGDEGEMEKNEQEEIEEDVIVKNFAPLSPPRRLNNQAPPTLPHLRKTGGNKTTSKSIYDAVGNSGKIPLNVGQKRILEEERERVIEMYREMKAQREITKKEEREKGKR